MHDMRGHMPRGLQQLVEYQVHRWELERRKGTPLHPAPCVAMSRLPGSGAASLGRRVAERLGYGFFGIEIVDTIARQQGVQRELVAALDEHVRSLIDRFVADSFRSRPFREGDYLRQVVHTVATLGQQGMAVILGRGSAFVLPPGQALRVLVVAPREARIEHLAKERSLSREQAEERLAREEGERREFNRYHFDVDPDDASLYDLVVNTATLGQEGAEELIVAALQRRFPKAPGAASRG